MTQPPEQANSPYFLWLELAFNKMVWAAISRDEIGAILICEVEWVQEYLMSLREPQHKRDMGIFEAIDAFGKDYSAQEILCTLATGKGDKEQLRKGLEYCQGGSQRLPQEKIDRAKQADLTAVAEALGLGPVYMGFIKSFTLTDQRTGSLKIYPAGRGWNDFAAGEGGDAISFVQRATDKSFRDAVEFLQFY